MKRALVTGGSGALGAAICRTLAGDGCHVLIHANGRTDRAEALAGAIREAGGSAETVAFDVTDAQAATAALERLLDGGPIQVLVNNAGVHDDAVMPAMRHDQWARVIDVSLNGFFNVTQPLLMPMIGTRWGRIVTVSSVAAVAGNRGQTNYAAAKAGLHGATKSLALELAPRGITVNAVAPGIIASPMADAAFDPEAVKRLVPMKRAGRPEEVADLVAFLASERAAYISGQVISINGGMI
ncbi:3-oxoacyl-ACP reductase FabG [Azospirillum picis]|uniref:3-oxoacyl-[acyl-carrier protein] reductase n=1 Tax=Azospirillum picis TaxID=488438 RepID=A0ABU0MQB6_9PROT|nr:3-oxoacyl-ACP reductase FabG [Azospirillum picis]MBP2302037.1 3-oxoacyl-[acyl-carrier protein] reductase [Azospirillum picis]MDQ0535672.1 3-oxoacyl-[acyl-carrier protein] reductase [Azospirillum picis]